MRSHPHHASIASKMLFRLIERELQAGADFFEAAFQVEVDGDAAENINPKPDLQEGEAVIETFVDVVITVVVDVVVVDNDDDLVYPNLYFMFRLRL